MTALAQALTQAALKAALAQTKADEKKSRRKMSDAVATPKLSSQIRYDTLSSVSGSFIGSCRPATGKRFSNYENQVVYCKPLLELETSKQMSINCLSRKMKVNNIYYYNKDHFNSSNKVTDLQTGETKYYREVYLGVFKVSTTNIAGKINNIFKLKGLDLVKKGDTIVVTPRDGDVPRGDWLILGKRRGV